MDVFEKGSNIDYDWIKSMLTRDWMSIARLEKAWRSLRVFHFSDSVRIGADSAARFLSLFSNKLFFSSLKIYIRENGRRITNLESIDLFLFVYRRINLPVRDSISTRFERN